MSAKVSLPDGREANFDEGTSVRAAISEIRDMFLLRGGGIVHKERGTVVSSDEVLHSETNYLFLHGVSDGTQISSDFADFFVFFANMDMDSV
jgi:hypothetical protein